MASGRPSSSNVLKSDPRQTHASTKLRTSSAGMRKEEQSAVTTKKPLNIETFACFWLDQDLHKTKDNEETQKELRKIINHLRTFENSDQCEQAIRETTQEKIVLVSSGSMGREIVPRLHELSQFSVCYIFCHDQTANKQWADNYAKVCHDVQIKYTETPKIFVKGIFTKRSELLAQFTQDQIIRIKIEDSAVISIVSGDSQSLESRNATFMWFQLFIEALIRMHHKSNTRQELIDLCKEYYQNNPGELRIIKEFEKTYESQNAIAWYTRECCLYRILNKALRIQDFDILFAFRFFITDLSKQLTNEYERYLRETSTRDIIRVYRGQAIGMDELKLIESSVGEYISMNSFLSTSFQRQIALDFLGTIESNKEIDRILFEIDIDPRQKTKAFSNIDRLSYFKNEDEVLIMLGALFRIQSIKKDKENKIWIANITLASENDFHLKETFAHMKEKIGDETDLHSIGTILIEMGEYNQARKCYKRMIYESKLQESVGFSGLGWADHWLNQYDEALSNFQKSLSLTNEFLPDLCEEKGRLYSLIGLVYWRKKQYKEALINLNKALDVQKIVLSPEHSDLLATYNRFALTYSGMNEVDMALEYYNKCLKIRLATLPYDHPDIATSYNNIGWLYNEQIGDYTKALDYFQKALTICRKILPPNHRDVIRTEKNISKVKEKLQDQTNV